MNLNFDKNIILSSKTPWIFPLKIIPNATARLFCFPYSGGSASNFQSWVKMLPSNVELFGIQLPGRGDRFNEELMRDFHEIIQNISKAITPYLDKNTIFFGHSLGALIAYETAVRLKKEQRYSIHHLVASARRAPHIPPSNTGMYLLSDTEFVDRLKKLNGIPNLILDNPEYISLFLPIIRSDFRLSETYKHESCLPLNCNITVLSGLHDNLTRKEGVEDWKQYTTKNFTHHVIEGGHFFINSHLSKVINIITPLLS